MKFSKLFWVFVVCTGVAGFGALGLSDARAQEMTEEREMTYEEYEMKLAGLEKRTSDTKAALAECNQKHDELKQAIADTEAGIVAVQEEIYRLVGSDAQGVQAYLNELDQIATQLMGLMNLSETELFARRREIEDLEAQFDGLKAQKIAHLPEAKEKIQHVEALFEKVKAMLPARGIDKYTVQSGDSLWRIAKSPDVYSDPYMWPRIYVENRTMIKNPDLIYPDWILDVPFGVDMNQHLVLSGQHLSSIAAMVYDDASKWHRIYRANKSQILNPNMVFPAQVLNTPAN